MGNKLFKNNQGFTLIEIIAVTVLAGVIGAVVMGVISNVIATQSRIETQFDLNRDGSDVLRQIGSGVGNDPGVLGANCFIIEENKLTYRYYPGGEEHSTTYEWDVENKSLLKTTETENTEVLLENIVERFEIIDKRESEKLIIINLNLEKRRGYTATVELQNTYRPRNSLRSCE